MASLLIKNAQVVSHDDELINQDVLVEDGKIAAIDVVLDAQAGPCDLTQQRLLTPGFCRYSTSTSVSRVLNIRKHW